MHGNFGNWAQLYGVTLAYAVTLTVLASPALLWLYRVRVSRWMSASAGAGQSRTNVETDRGLLVPDGLAWRRVSLGNSTAAAAEPADAADRPAARRLAASYAAGGLAHALVMTTFLALAFADLVTPSILSGAFVVFLLPALATVLHLLSSRPRTRAIVFVGAGALLYLSLGTLRDLALSLFTGFVLLPTALLLLFSLRFWRGIAPLMLLLSLLASLFAVAGVQVARHVFGLSADAVWPWRMAGFALGGGVGFLILRALQTAYEQRRFSDQELFVDTWWVLYTLLQVLVLVFMKRDPSYFLALSAFLALEVVRRGVQRLLAPVSPRARPRHLLLLRVFADDGRTEKLYAQFEHRWRYHGGIRMIAGRDLALRNIGPADFVAFVSARLRERFVSGAVDLDRRLQALDDAPDPDGRYRVDHFWCHADTWRPTMSALADRCDAVLMDLRGFTAEREGCRFELQHLAHSAPKKPVLLLVDDEASEAAVRDMLHPTEDRAGAWCVARLDKRTCGVSDRLFCLLSARTAPGA